MLTLNLYGSLAKAVGQSEVKLDVDTPGDALNVLLIQVPDAFKAMRSANWTLINGDLETGVALSPDNLHVVACPEVHLIPATEGGNGTTMMIAGAALMAVGAFTFGLSTPTGMALFASGAATAVGGVMSTMIKPTAASYESSDSKGSYMYNGTVNTTVQGQPYACPYGMVEVGSIQGSASLVAEEYVGDN